MKLTTVTLDYVTDLGEVSGVCVYGVGLLTSLFYCICSLIGKSSVFLGRKLERAKEKAVEEMKVYAQEKHADGVMNIRYQMSGLSVMVYGTAFSYAADAPLDELPPAEPELSIPEKAEAAIEKLQKEAAEEAAQEAQAAEEAAPQE